MLFRSINGWKDVLSEFDFTQHQITNVICYEHERGAHLKCYIDASHFLNDREFPAWEFIGSYDVILHKNINMKWQIRHLILNLKYQIGSIDLKQNAISFFSRKSEILTEDISVLKNVTFKNEIGITLSGTFYIGRASCRERVL